MNTELVITVGNKKAEDGTDQVYVSAVRGDVNMRLRIRPSTEAGGCFVIEELSRDSETYLKWPDRCPTMQVAKLTIFRIVLGVSSL